MIEDIAASHPEAGRVEIWFQDETRIGQTGRTCRRWFEKGVRPRGHRDLRHQALYLFGAVCPARDEAVELVLPDVSTVAMQALLDELSKAVDQDAHALVIMDRAGWHCAKTLMVPDNLSLAFLPPYSPELNVIERVWLYLKERYLSLRVWPDYDDILDAVCKAWNKLLDEPGRIKSLTDADWLLSVKT